MKRSHSPIRGVPGVSANRGLRDDATWLFRRATSALRILPAFVIIGAQKAGTTSLHQYLLRSPYVLRALRKEIHYFDRNYARGEPWYRAHFPTRPAAALASRPGTVAITGEATPYYLFHPDVPDLMARDLPQARIIVLLRDPVARAYSHYQHERALGHEPLELEDALAAERDRLASAPGGSFAHQHHSYIARGMYATQLSRWYGHFEQSRVLLLAAEDLFADPEKVTNRVLDFLGLPPVELGGVGAHNARSYTSMGADVRAWLESLYRDENQRLRAEFGFTAPWC